MPDPIPTAVQASADVSAITAQLAAAEARALEAETRLAALQLSARTERVKSLFSTIGRDYSDAAAAPFLAMDDNAFSAAAEIAQFKAPAPPAHLFGAGPAPKGDTPSQPAKSLDPTAIYAARQAKHKEQ